jgi:hypothetical protein
MSHVTIGKVSGGYTKTQYAKLSTWEYDLVTSPTFQKVKIWGVGGVC